LRPPRRLFPFPAPAPRGLALNETLNIDFYELVSVAWDASKKSFSPFPSFFSAGPSTPSSARIRRPADFSRLHSPLTIFFLRPPMFFSPLPSRGQDRLAPHGVYPRSPARQPPQIGLLSSSRASFSLSPSPKVSRFPDMDGKLPPAPWGQTVVSFSFIRIPFFMGPFSSRRLFISLFSFYTVMISSVPHFPLDARSVPRRQI